MMNDNNNNNNQPPPVSTTKTTQMQSPTHLHLHRPITTSLLRKRSEHNSNLISTLEEIALHQEELTDIGSTIGKVCGKTLKILLLQNNVIGELKVEELKYFKVLEYLNLALNNLKVVSGFGTKNTSAHGCTTGTACTECTECTECTTSANECLSKIDLTLNFIDFDRLEESMNSLATLRNLKELFMMGNPCCLPERIQTEKNMDTASAASTTSCPGMNDIVMEQKPKWQHFRLYVISKLEKLEYLDGKQILRSERIKAMQMKSTLDRELALLAEQCLQSKKNNKNKDTSNLSQHGVVHREKEGGDDACDGEERTSHCPEDRIKISHEMASQKAEKERHEKANQPKFKGEKELEEDQQKSIEMAREREERGDIRQCNGKR